MPEVKLDKAKKAVLMDILDSLSPEEIDEKLKGEEIYVSIKIAYDRRLIMPYEEGMKMINLMRSAELRKNDGYDDPYYIKSWDGELSVEMVSHSQYVEEKMLYILFKENNRETSDE